MANRLLSQDEIKAELARLDAPRPYVIGNNDISGSCGSLVKYTTADLMLPMEHFSERILQPLVKQVRMRCGQPTLLDQRDADRAEPLLTRDTGIHGAMLGQRGATHGDYRAMSTRIQQIKAIMRTGSKWADMAEPQKEALELIATKIGRIIEGDPEFKDHWDDLGGYAAKASEFCRKGTTSA